MSFIGRLSRGIHYAAVMFCLGIGMIISGTALADTNLVNKQSWVIDGSDDTGANPTNIAVSVQGQAMGSFSELVVSYDVGGTGVVTVCKITGTARYVSRRLPRVNSELHFSRRATGIATMGSSRP